MADSLFWADQIAARIMERKKFHFNLSKVPKLKKWSVKSSSSLSGVLHIGRLSDLVRGEAVFHALKDAGFPAEFIYVTEDMDPLRKVPKGVPEKFAEYIGFPVSDVPDPWGCHKSYDKHFLGEFLESALPFLSEKPKVFSMREEYKKGHFNKSSLQLMKQKKLVLEIINKFKKEPVSEDWIPWQPICEKCGNLQTARAVSFDGKQVEYECLDYSFEKATAKGCGHKGFSELKKANGKMPWKSEWAMQWKHWNVCAEGAGKEYESKNSAFWINAEICEKALDFPMPEPIFYEHLMIGGVKMSASLGNVVFPKDWLLVSRPETLRMLYLKRLMKTRSFSWDSVPLLELELDRLAESVAENKGDEKDKAQNKRLLQMIAAKNRKITGTKVDFSSAMVVAQLFSDNKKAFSKLEEMGIIAGKASKEEKSLVLERIALAREYSKRHLPKEKITRFVELSEIDNAQIPEQAKILLPAISDKIQNAKNAEELQSLIFATAKENNLQPKELFKALYRAVLNTDSGPKFGSLAFAFGKDKVAKRLMEIK